MKYRVKDNSMSFLEMWLLLPFLWLFYFIDYEPFVIQYKKNLFWRNYKNDGFSVTFKTRQEADEYIDKLQNNIRW